MSYSVFTQAQPLEESFSVRDERDVLAVRFTGQGEQRAARGSRRFRSWSLVFRVTAATRDLIDAFFLARGYTYEAFLWTDPLASFVAGVAMGSSTAGQVAFVIPTTGESGGYYPVSDPRTVLYDDGAIIASTVTTDSRTLTVGGAPTAASTMTADLVYYRLVRLAEPYEWRRLGGGAAYEASMRFVEVPS